MINNDNITKMYGSLPFVEALHKADDVLATAAKGIAELVTRHGIVNVDFADVRTVMLGSGMALMGSARATGERKVDEAVERAIASPLLNHQDILGAKNILLNLSYAENDDLTFEEASRAQEIIQTRASRAGGYDANIIWGAGSSSELQEGEIEVTLVATGFDSVTELSQPFRERPKLDNVAPTATTTAPTPLQVESTPAPKPSVEWTIREHYTDIDTLFMQPAFFRRGMQLDGIKGAVQIDGQVGEKVKEQPAPPTEGTLF